MLFALGMWMSTANYSAHSGYVVSDISAAGIALCYSGPLLAGFAAFWFRGRPRFHRTMRSSRSGVAVLLTGGWPLLIGGPLVCCAAVLLSARALPTDLVSAQLMVVFFAVLAACALLGAVSAWALPVVIAVPASTIACFMWISYLPSTGSPLLHHMSPTIDGFAPTARPASSGIVAVLILAATVALGAIACLGRRTWDRTPRLAAVPVMLAVPLLAVGLSAGYLHTSTAPMGLMVTQDRSTPLTCTTHHGLKVCLWPEVADRAEEVVEATASMNTTLESWGLPRITTIGQDRQQASDALYLRVDGTTDPAGLRLMLAEGYIEQQKTSCAAGEGQAFYERSVVLARAQGVSTAELAAEFPQETLKAASEVVQEFGGRELGAWFTEGLDQVRCWPSA
ncbi:hypothetical protein GHK92_12685 [Nocardioides sp. dk4132]|uniref:DUF7224 domain-containing protein n=1 Tax=unclassified Nocardioides TaxID=2615069 RepID=UPI001298203E|nr:MULTISPECIES: hypothetical protein [unclassified Nocardioides]MQW76735.1 hypothetical protein [Nocardioides sp. dk4132]QGA06908.1 hypothetical protein GFH29_05535 [Nocardioides sp. dk884]